jgi:large subunit ribosomal protein L21
MSEITVLRVTEILTDNKQPTIGPRPKKEKPVAAAPADDNDEAPKKTVKKKAPAKKAVAKAVAKPRAKPDAKKAPAKKSAAKGKSDKK